MSNGFWEPLLSTALVFWWCLSVGLHCGHLRCSFSLKTRLQAEVLSLSMSAYSKRWKYQSWWYHLHQNHWQVHQCSSLTLPDFIRHQSVCRPLLPSKSGDHHLPTCGLQSEEPVYKLQQLSAGFFLRIPLRNSMSQWSTSAHWVLNFSLPQRKLLLILKLVTRLETMRSPFCFRDLLAKPSVIMWVPSIQLQGTLERTASSRSLFAWGQGT